MRRIQERSEKVHQALEALYREVPHLRNHFHLDISGDDIDLILTNEKKRCRYCIEVKAGTLSSSALPRLDEKARHCRSGEQLMVIADQITSSLAAILQGKQIAFIDCAGNAWITGPLGLHIWISGKRVGSKRVVTGLHRQSAVKVIFAILSDWLNCSPSDRALLNRPVRAIAAAADVALGSVGGVLDDLRRLGFVLDNNETWLFAEPERLIELWTTDYLARLRHRLIVQRYRSKRIRDWKTWPMLPVGAKWGGEIAAYSLTHYLDPETATIYASKLSDEWIVRAGWTPDPEGNIEVIKPFWGETLVACGVVDYPQNCVHPLLVYADLLACDDERCTETARRIYDTYLRRLN